MDNDPEFFDDNEIDDVYDLCDNYVDEDDDIDEYDPEHALMVEIFGEDYDL